MLCPQHLSNTNKQEDEKEQQQKLLIMLNDGDDKGKLSQMK